MSRLRLSSSVLALLALGACSGANARSTPAASSPLSSSVIEIPGKRIEVIGLRRWTVSMIQDSLGKYSPGDSLHSHACAAVLRYKLGFADASATTIRSEGDPIEQVIVGVVEPEDSVRVRYRAVPMDTTTFREEWASLIHTIRREPWVFQAAIQQYLNRASGMPVYLRRDSAAVTQVWAFLEAHQEERDAALARQSLLDPDPSVYNRIAAAAILLNFPEADSTWWTLAEAMREPDGGAGGTAGMVLSHLAYYAARPVDWAPAAPTIHAILDGTSLFQLGSLIQALNATEVIPAQARLFLADGGRMLVAYAGAESEMVSTPALELLVRLSGENHGKDRHRWAEWIRALE